MLIMHRCQPLVLIFQLSKILEQRTLAPLSLDPGSIHVYNSSKHVIEQKMNN